MPRVSVIIPTWERSRWLSRALESVYAQTDHDFEVLVVDDGSSTDAAERVARARADMRVRYLKLPQHRGVSAARNAGLLAATGKYVAFLDDDDEWLPEKLTHQLAVIEASDTSISAVYTARFSVDERTGRISTTRFAKRFRPGAGNIVTTSSVLIRRECFDSVGLFDEEFEAGGDYDMWIRIGRQFEFAYVDIPLVKYHVHADSLSTDYRKKRRASELLLKKHWALFAADPSDLARQYATLGVMFYQEGRVMEALRAFWKAMRVSPLEIDTYAATVRTFFKLRTITLMCRPTEVLSRSV
jgi:glycosyltransferase involved in cell wall biosynthesis